MIAHARHDENGGITGGKPGDQTGGEVAITEWYNRPWNVVLRCPDPEKREKIAAAAEAAARNDLIGYDQNDRDSLFVEASKVGFDLSAVKTPCETDCSELVMVCCRAAGFQADRGMYTGNEKMILKRLGFQVLTKPYTTSPDDLLRGDILLYEGHHTAVNLTDGLAYSKPAYALGWHRDDTGWWYADMHDHFYSDCWADINGHRYHFTNEGYMETGLTLIDGELYYFLEEPEDICGGLCITDQTGKLSRMEV